MATQGGGGNLKGSRVIFANNCPSIEAERLFSLFPVFIADIFFFFHNNFEKSNCNSKRYLNWFFLREKKSMKMSIAIFSRFIYIMYGMRYLSIVDSRFVKIAITLAWFIPLILTISAYVGFQDTVSNYFNMQCLNIIRNIYF